MHYAKLKRDTKEYRAFKGEIFELLGNQKYAFKDTDMFKLTTVVGYSSSLSDLDNALKPEIDSLQLAMGFNDRQIFEIVALKDKTKKGQEYIMLRLETITSNTWKKRIKELFPVFFKET